MEAEPMSAPLLLQGRYFSHNLDFLNWLTRWISFNTA
jgi:hypothetical protein